MLPLTFALRKPTESDSLELARESQPARAFIGRPDLWFQALTLFSVFLVVLVFVFVLVVVHYLAAANIQPAQQNFSRNWK